MEQAFITVIGQYIRAGDREVADYYFCKLFHITVFTFVIWNAAILAAAYCYTQYYALSGEVKQLIFMLVLIHNVFNSFLFALSHYSWDMDEAGSYKYYTCHVLWIGHTCTLLYPAV